MKSSIFALVALVATATLAQDGTTSVLTANQTPTPATQAATDAKQAATATAAPTAAGCCETAKEVRLTAWQARRLARQADRQEARDCRDCCNGKCDCKDACKPTAIVITRTRPTCTCCK